MQRRQFIILFGSAAAWPLAVRVQEPLKAPTVGFLGAESASTDQQVFDAFREGMHEHGYVEGKNVAFVERWAEGRSERFPELIGELFSLKVNVILAISAPARSRRSARLPRSNRVHCELSLGIGSCRQSGPASRESYGVVSLPRRRVQQQSGLNSSGKRFQASLVWQFFGTRPILRALII